MQLLPAELWNEREPREKALLVALLIFMVTVVFYMLVYQPLHSQYAQAQIHYQQSAKDYRWLRDQITTIAALKSTARGADLVMEGISKLRAEIDQSLKKHRLTADVTIMDEEEGGKFIEIKFGDAGGREVLKWLEENMQSGHLLHAFELNHKGSGNVSAVAYFELKPSNQ
ncbi:MAG: type II secretion system protein M [Gammaproteobacteria bacterium]|nr:type II secretion system protein M [Gammaproteobacteria bacterium]